MKWINIIPAHGRGKTKRWCVMTADGSTELGWISFYSRWRKYSFFPNPETLYEADCLRDIANFCETETKLWRASLKRPARVSQVTELLHG
jgi:hypothetical protein